MAKIISLFNHKGGVGKTTSVFHLGWMMANLGKKVLIVDADPQCNLTGLTLNLTDYDSFHKFYDSKQNTDIYNSLAPDFAIDSSLVAGSVTSITQTENPNLYMLAGNIKFSELDSQIATAMTASSALPILRKFVGAFNRLIRKIGQEKELDFILIDMSPSISSTNQAILMSSDYFIIPVSPDFYCHQAIDSLNRVLPEWAKNIKDFRKNDEFSLPLKAPKMMGFISQNYRVYTKKGVDNEEKFHKDMSKAYAEWLEKISQLATTKFVPTLEREKMIVDKKLLDKYATYGKAYHLMGIQEFNFLIPISQKVKKPIYALEKEDGKWAGAVWYKKDENGTELGVKVNIEQAKLAYENLATAVINIANHDE